MFTLQHIPTSPIPNDTDISSAVSALLVGTSTKGCTPQTPGSTQNLIGRFCRKDFVELFHVFLAFCSVALLEDVRGSRADVDTRRRRAVVNLRYACAQWRFN